MNLKELVILLKGTGFPVAYSHFNQTTNTPFICYLNAYSSHFMADNTVYKKINNVQVELYTDQKNIEAEEKLEAIFIENELPFSCLETYIESENMYQVIYEITLI